MVHSIAVTTDFSPLARQAYWPARALAERFKARLFLVHIPPAPHAYRPWQVDVETPADVRRRRAEALRSLEDAAATEPAFDGVRVEARVLKGTPMGALLGLVQDEGIDLIVLATRAQEGSKQLKVGSFASMVLHTARCPVLVYRAGVSRRRGGKGAFVPKHIVVPHDFSRPSDEALNAARAWARAFGASVRLVHVLDPDAVRSGYADQGVGAPRARDIEDLRKEALARLAEIAKEDWEDVAVKTVARVGKPHEGILEEVRGSRADMVVMASRGLSAAELAVLGSVADGIIRAAPCPVLVVRRH